MYRQDTARGFGLWLRSATFARCGALFLFTIDLLIPESYIGVNNFLIPKSIKKKMGRPKLPKEKAKAFQIGVRFTRQEGEKIKRAASGAAQTTARWVRETLLAAVKD